MTDEPVLTQPTADGAARLLDYVDEFEAFAAAGRPAGPADAHEPIWWARQRDRIVADWPGLLAEVRRHARGEGLPEHWVPTEHHWLVQGERILATGRLRLRLTDRLRAEGGHIGYETRPSERGRGHGTLLLRLVLRRAARHAIGTALVTCDDVNVASARVIEKCGGVLRSTGPVAPEGKLVRRYDVATAPWAGDGTEY